MNGCGHGHLAAVRQHEARAAGAEVLDQGEDVVPAAGVQARGVVAQFVEDLLHLERGGDGLDQHGGADGALRDAQQVLGQDEDVVPQPGLEVVLDLRQVEVRALALGDQAAGVVEEVQAEVHDAAGDRGAVDEHVLLRQVPAAGPDHDRGQLPGGAELVLLALRGGEVDPALQGVGEVQLALDDVAPRRGGGVLHVREPHLGAGVQRVDGHLLVHRPGDLHAAVLQARGRGSDAPVRIVADGLGLAEEPRVLALADLLRGGPAGPAAAPAGAPPSPGAAWRRTPARPA